MRLPIVMCMVIANVGCASITEGTTQTITVNTDKPCVASRGDYVATITPEANTMTITKGNDPIKLECAGVVKEIKSSPTKAALTGAMLLDFGIVDMITGAFWKYDDVVNVGDTE